MIKLIARYFVKQACRKACDGDIKDYYELQSLMFTEIKACDTESNDSTIYSWMHEEFVLASQCLKHVSKTLRP
jgi:hypothetical protein